eukprot:1161773-Pelagomonas_calceolata.AAC.5
MCAAEGDVRCWCATSGKDLNQTPHTSTDKPCAANAAATAAAASGKMLSRPAPKLSKEELQKAEVRQTELLTAIWLIRGLSAVQPYSQQFGIGATLLSKMGFGAMQGSKGGLGAKEQVCLCACACACVCARVCVCVTMPVSAVLAVS